MGGAEPRPLRLLRTSAYRHWRRHLLERERFMTTLRKPALPSRHLLLSLLAALSLTACGGWMDDDKSADGTAGTDSATSTAGTAASTTTTGSTSTTTTAAAAALTCNTAGYVAGSVELPTSAQLAAYAGTYDGEEGQYGPNPGDPFVKSASATMVFGADGSLSYKGTSYTVTSACVDKAAGTLGKVLYIVAGKGHLDIADKVDPTLGNAWGVALADGTTIFTKALKR
jgi:hypothetical protein